MNTEYNNDGFENQPTQPENTQPTTPQPDYNQPTPSQTVVNQPTESAGMAIASMVLGITSLLFSCCYGIFMPAAIVGIILGALSLKRTQVGKGMAIAGIITSAVGLFLALIVIASLIFTLSIPFMMDPMWMYL